MSETQQGFYSNRNEPLTHIELFGRSDALAEQRVFLVDTGFNGGMLVPLHIVKAMGWPMTNEENYVTYGGGQKTNIMRTHGYVKFKGQLITINVLAIISPLSSDDIKSEVIGYIGMELLKESRINFGKYDFNISPLEG